MTQQTKRDLVLKAIEHLGRPCSVQQISEWLEDHFDHQSYKDVPNCLSALTINDRSRHHNDRNRTNFAVNRDHPHDRLIKARVRGSSSVRYWFYNHCSDGPMPHVSSEDLDWTYNRKEG